MSGELFEWAASNEVQVRLCSNEHGKSVNVEYNSRFERTVFGVAVPVDGCLDDAVYQGLRALREDYYRRRAGN